MSIVRNVKIVSNMHHFPMKAIESFYRFNVNPSLGFFIERY